MATKCIQEEQCCRADYIYTHFVLLMSSSLHVKFHTTHEPTVLCRTVPWLSRSFVKGLWSAHLNRKRNQWTWSSYVYFMSQTGMKALSTRLTIKQFWQSPKTCERRKRYYLEMRSGKSAPPVHILRRPQILCSTLTTLQEHASSLFSRDHLLYFFYTGELTESLILVQLLKENKQGCRLF